MRQADEGSAMKLEALHRTQRRGDAEKRKLDQVLCVSASLRHALLFALLVSASHAAVTGVVINRTTGKPQAGATVALNQLAQQAGITLLDQAKSDAQGRFSIP